METSYNDFKHSLDGVYSKLPGSGRREVLLARLYSLVYKTLDERFNRALSKDGLTRTTFNALLLLYADPENAVSPSGLSLVLDSSRTNITRVADEMEENGWLERRTDPRDRRRLCLSLTDAGRALVEDVMPRQRSSVEAIWSILADEEQEELERLLRKFYNGLMACDHPACENQDGRTS